ncbi:toll/interleukin-1 receptor domain-containing protein [Leptospira harrisiae]|uniref:toll/interleukin-1 receptor domain-containing protein n=1 Tax=Leptospira harrisiae TaxID=2023189 RepID=UPI000C2AAD15|nr:toll/interleukin-1 receptor domain-containing protein [Leptospira harrisiae]PKA06391.1 hypothetical protein CH366_19380 [Leptospira harrisiae]
MINLTRGSIFDSHCDLLVVPCDSNGGVTDQIFNKLIENGIYTDFEEIPFGQIRIINSKYEYANAICYASSVNAIELNSSRETIIKISNQILDYSLKNKIKIINIPLLGSGAGGLSPIDSFESIKSVFEKNSEITVSIFCYTNEIYQSISHSGNLSIDKKKSPRVFISYTGKDKKNSDWVLNFAKKLRANGIDARIDKFHLKAGVDLPQWMTDEVLSADKVILICDKYYMEKADVRKGGVGWETMIIQGDMLSQGDSKEKYIAIIRENKAEKALPIYLKSKYALHWGKDDIINEEKLKALIIQIFDQVLEPELGPIPDYIK